MRLLLISIILLCGCASVKHVSIEYPPGENTFVQVYELPDGRRVYQEGDYDREYIDKEWEEYWEWYAQNTTVQGD